MYLFSPLSLLALPALRRLPKVVWGILAFYALSQQLPALFSPEPLLASCLALGRTLLMFGLIGMGVVLGAAERLRPLGVGLALIYVTALVYSWLSGSDILVSRLTHPYMTSIALGLGGTFGIWLALFAGGQLWWRISLGVAGLGVLLLSGSRGPLLAALVGCLAGFIVQRGRKVALALLLGVGLLLGGFYVGDRLGLGAITRLESADTTGRDIVWYDTLTVIQSQPWAGVGSYRLGRYLAPPSEGCPLVSPSPQAASIACPGWIRQLGSPWLIAHNLTLQQLAETGPLGLLGLLLLLAAVVTATGVARSALGAAVVAGLLAGTVNDNTLLVPSPFFAELFWLVAGTQLAQLKTLGPALGWLGTGLIMLLSLPLLAGVLPQVGSQGTQSVQISFLNAPVTAQLDKRYKIFVRFSIPPGFYRVSLDTCLSSCVTLTTTAFEAGADNSPVLSLEAMLRPVVTQRLELHLLTGRASFNMHPIGIKSWVVKEKF